MTQAVPPAASPSISVIIPSYNHGKYVARAIESALAQTDPAPEVVVVDDGSTDDTRDVASRYPGVVCVSQENRGLSAARNRGITASRGDLLVFLDADDRLLPGALTAGILCLSENPEAGFVSGRHVRVDPEGRILERREDPQPESEHYLALLRGNYIGMHATVMYRRKALEAAGGFDVGLPACEDYDIYLRIARSFGVAFHDAIVAEYFIHDENMSHDVGLMLATVLVVLRRQKAVTDGDLRREQALEDGVASWRRYYSREMITRFRNGSKPMVSPRELVGALGRNAPGELASFAIREVRRRIRSAIRQVLPGRARRFLAGHSGGHFAPRVGRVAFGDLRRLRPISRCYGFDRGLPIDRHYIEKFLSQRKHLVKGRVLEIGDNAYTLRFGGDQVERSEVLHAVEGNPKATYVGDLTNAPQLPSNAFDCIILTQTLHLIYDMRAALATVCRILKPGGVLLATVPGISQIEDGTWSSVWHWSLTTLSARKLLEEDFPASAVEVEAHGNVLTSISFLQGLAAEELSPAELEHQDPLYPMLITLVATKTLP